MRRFWLIFELLLYSFLSANVARELAQELMPNPDPIRDITVNDLESVESEEILESEPIES